MRTQRDEDYELRPRERRYAQRAQRAVLVTIIRQNILRRRFICRYSLFLRRLMLMPRRYALCRHDAADYVLMPLDVTLFRRHTYLPLMPRCRHRSR